MKYQLKVTSEPVIRVLLDIAKRNNLVICSEYQRKWKYYPYFILDTDWGIHTISGNETERSGLITVTLEEMFELLAGGSISKMKLNDNYTVEVNHRLRKVNVGCQSFDFSVIDTLHELIHKQK